MADGPDFPSPTLAVVIAVEAARDAVNFVNTQPADSINVEKLVDGLVMLYRSVGLDFADAKLLYQESMQRASARFVGAYREFNHA